MPSQPIHSLSDSHSTLLQACRQQHRVWSVAIDQSEQEIDQLLIRLHTVLKQTDSRPLNTQTTYYYTTLKRLKYHFHRLQLDRVCQNTACLNKGKKPCSKPRISFLSVVSVDEQLRSLTDELSQIRNELNQPA